MKILFKHQIWKSQRKMTFRIINALQNVSKINFYREIKLGNISPPLPFHYALLFILPVLNMQDLESPLEMDFFLNFQNFDALVKFLARPWLATYSKVLKLETLYIRIIDCVKKNWARTTMSWEIGLLHFPATLYCDCKQKAEWAVFILEQANLMLEIHNWLHLLSPKYLFVWNPYICDLGAHAKF